MPIPKTPLRWKAEEWFTSNPDFLTNTNGFAAADDATRHAYTNFLNHCLPTFNICFPNKFAKDIDDRFFKSKISNMTMQIRATKKVGIVRPSHTAHGNGIKRVQGEKRSITHSELAQTKFWKEGRKDQANGRNRNYKTVTVALPIMSRSSVRSVKN